MATLYSNTTLPSAASENIASRHLITRSDTIEQVLRERGLDSSDTDNIIARTRSSVMELLRVPDDTDAAVRTARRSLCALGLLSVGHQLSAETNTDLFLSAAQRVIRDMAHETKNPSSIPDDAMLHFALHTHSAAYRAIIAGLLMHDGALPREAAYSMSALPRTKQFREALCGLSATLEQSTGMRIVPRQDPLQLATIDKERRERFYTSYSEFVETTDVALSDEQLAFLKRRPEGNKFSVITAVRHGDALTIEELLAVCDDRVSTISDVQEIVNQCNYVVLRKHGLEIKRNNNLYKLARIDAPSKDMMSIDQHIARQAAKHETFTQTLGAVLQPAHITALNCNPHGGPSAVINLLSAGNAVSEQQIMDVLKRRVRTRAVLINDIAQINANHLQSRGLAIRQCASSYKLVVTDPNSFAAFSNAVHHAEIQHITDQQDLYGDALRHHIAIKPDSDSKQFLLHMYEHRAVPKVTMRRIIGNGRSRLIEVINKGTLRPMGITCVAHEDAYILTITDRERFAAFRANHLSEHGPFRPTLSPDMCDDLCARHVDTTRQILAEVRLGASVAIEHLMRYMPADQRSTEAVMRAIYVINHRTLGEYGMRIARENAHVRLVDVDASKAATYRDTVTARSDRVAQDAREIYSPVFDAFVTAMRTSKAKGCMQVLLANHMIDTRTAVQTVGINYHSTVGFLNDSLLPNLGLRCVLYGTRYVLEIRNPVRFAAWKSYQQHHLAKSQKATKTLSKKTPTEADTEYIGDIPLTPVHTLAQVQRWGGLGRSRASFDMLFTNPQRQAFGGVLPAGTHTIAARPYPRLLYVLTETNRTAPHDAVPETADSPDTDDSFTPSRLFARDLEANTPYTFDIADATPVLCVAVRCNKIGNSRLVKEIPQNHKRHHRRHPARDMEVESMQQHDGAECED